MPEHDPEACPSCQETAVAARNRRHAPAAGLCELDHLCPACIRGDRCVDLFMDPVCGLVACMNGEVDE
jgi:hypothetical protein